MRKREPISSLGLADMHVRCLPPGAYPRCCFTPAGSLPTGYPAPQSPGASRLFAQILRERMFEAIKTRALCYSQTVTRLRIRSPGRRPVGTRCRGLGENFARLTSPVRGQIVTRVQITERKPSIPHVVGFVVASGNDAEGEWVRCERRICELVDALNSIRGEKMG
jgi:hypothetical protein